MPRTFRPYLLALSGLTVWLFCLVLTQGIGERRPVQPLLAGLLVAISIAGYQFPVQLAPKRKVHVGSSPLLAAALLFSAAQALTMACAATFLGNLLLRVQLPLLDRRPQDRPIWNCLFNALQTGLALGAASTVYHLLAGNAERFAPTTLFEGVAVVLAVLVAYLSTNLLVAIAITLYQGHQHPLRLCWEACQDDWREEGGLALLAIVSALVAGEYPWAVLLQAGAIAVIQLSYRNAARVRQQTKATIEQLAVMVDQRDPYTCQHSKNVARYAVALAQRLGLSQAQVELLRSAALVHDIGKLGIRDGVLLKPGRLTDEEVVEMQRHPEIGAELVSQLPDYRPGLALILHHHEAWDGSGYPHGLTGEQIPLGARILAVADSYDAMATDRPYRKALPLAVIVEQFRKGRGRQWEPRLVDLWLEALEQAAPQPVPALRLAPQSA